VKVRIGFGLGTRTLVGRADRFAAVVDDLEALGFDSLWLSERVHGEAPDPLVGLAVAAGRTRRLKLGTSVLVLPGRNPALTAKAFASLDRLSGGRALPAVGLGVADPVEQQAFGVERGDRAAMFDEAIGLVRRLWTEDDVAHEGRFFRYDGVTVLPRPVQDPLEIWLGGIAPSELRRVGRLGDGWLPSFCTVDEVAAGIPTVQAHAADAGRAIDPEHFGVLVAYAHGEIPPPLAAFVEHRRPGLDPSAVVPSGFDALRARVAELVDTGASKFVVVPVTDPPNWHDELAALAEALLPLET
jgi:probable F420-dependent oxidoreductase